MTDMKEQILSFLSPEYPWKDRLFVFPELDSTNNRLKALASQGASHGTVLIADRQTGGRGRMGRSFLSPPGVGIYMSILLRPECAPQELMHLTCAVAAAMCRAVERSVGLRPGIKWTNDLVWGKQKFAGILTEMGLNAAGGVDWTIVGIGVNCCQKAEDFPPDIRGRACSLAMATGQEIDRCRVVAAMMESLWEMDASLFTGKEDMLRFYRKTASPSEKTFPWWAQGKSATGGRWTLTTKARWWCNFPTPTWKPSTPERSASGECMGMSDEAPPLFSIYSQFTYCFL